MTFEEWFREVKIASVTGGFERISKLRAETKRMIMAIEIMKMTFAKISEDPAVKYAREQLDELANGR